MLKIYIYIVMLFSITACTYSSEKNSTKNVLTLDNTTIEIKNIDIYTRQKGIFSGHEYGKVYSFKYNIKLSPQSVSWSNIGSVWEISEPKSITLCEEKQVYIGALVVDNNGGPLNDIYYKLIDERYLFKLLGEYHWEGTNEEQYLKETKSCSTQELPNDRHFEKSKG